MARKDVDSAVGAKADQGWKKGERVGHIDTLWIVELSFSDRYE